MLVYLWLIIYGTNGLSMNLAWLFRKAPWHKLSRAYRFKHLLLKSA